MTLLIGGERNKIANPTDQDIRKALGSFNAKNIEQGDAFVILFGASEMTYMQASGEKVGGFDIEYQEGDTKHHYRAKRADFTLEEIVAMLSAYLEGKPDWQQMAEWEKITF